MPLVGRYVIGANPYTKYSRPLRGREYCLYAVNEELLLTAWQVGGYVSAKLKSEEWGSKVVSQLSEYIRTLRPDIKGYSKRSIYNMVMFYEEYSSETFFVTVEKYLNSQFVQPTSAQIETQSILPNTDSNIIVQMPSAQIVQSVLGQMPKILELTTLTNHVEILCRSKATKSVCSIFFMPTKNIWLSEKCNAASPIRPMRLC